MGIKSILSMLSVCVLAFSTTIANAALIYDLSSNSDPTTFGTILINTNVGDTYDPWTDIVEWDITIAGVASNQSISNITGRTNPVFVATSIGPIDNGFDAFSISDFNTINLVLGLDKVAALDNNCAGPVASCIDAVGGTLVSDISWSLRTVPVPAAAWLFVSGLMGMIGVVRKKGGLIEH